VANREDRAYATFGENNKNELYAANIATGVIYHLEASSLLEQSFSDAADAKESSLRIYPNPSKGKFEIQYTGVSVFNCIITVHDKTGNIIYTASKNMQPGTNTWSIALPATAKGNYYVSLSNNAGKLCGGWVTME
ncbi:MAG TPA: T9SS type A sorting domain-containing protein, partial [Chitinophagaceae bacterium]|nr:T9SS type A sorting domain-containing protein [Chitinophagaceae bacterium]